MNEKPTVFALDFGTTNSLLAAAGPGRTFPPLALDPDAEDPTILRSALHFTSATDVVFGQAALRRFVAAGLKGRLLRSIKRHLGSRVFEATRIDGTRITLEELVAALLRTMRERACRTFDADVDRVVLGRPARFSDRSDEDAMAEVRLERAAQLAGFRDIWFCHEPVAAAYDFADVFDRSRTIVIADFGGGTSDFTVARTRPSAFAAEDVLAVGGISVAGDALDGRLVRSIVAPLLGSEARYRLPAGSNVLTMPGELLQLLCSPARLTLAESRVVLESLDAIRRGLLDKRDAVALARYATLVGDAVGYQFYEAVESAKVRLSRVDSTLLQFDYPGIDLSHLVTRQAFELAVAPTLEQILGALDATLEQAGVAASQVEIMCLTGGTSMVPILEASLRGKLTNATLVRLRSHHSVVQGLARFARALEDGHEAARSLFRARPCDTTAFRRRMC